MTLAAQILGALCLVLGVFFWNGSASAVQEAASALVLILGVLLIGLAAIVAAIHRLRESIEGRLPEAIPVSVEVAAPPPPSAQPEDGPGPFQRPEVERRY